LLASGLCVGITILFRHDVGIASPAGGAFTLSLFHMTQQLDAPQKISALLRPAAAYSGGIALALIPPLALLVAADAAHGMLPDLVLIPVRTYIRMRSLPFPSVVELARDVIHPSHRRKGLDAPSLAVYLPNFGRLAGRADHELVVALGGRPEQARV
jgi:hypothetical protein